MLWVLEGRPGDGHHQDRGWQEGGPEGGHVPQRGSLELAVDG